MDVRKTYFSVIAVFSLICMFAIGCSRAYAGVSFVNKSNIEIQELNVSICGNDYQIKHISGSTEASVEYSLCSEGSYFVQVLFANGEMLDKEVGYVTNVEGRLNDVIHITSNDIFFTDRKVE
ncbi:MAG TPA: hypothetical protein PLY88_03675 [Candidatus Omnitrophota bacterium]|nr:hypothetical protein [Candidatus Omnitrophota bacterium]